jgi:multidrug efflux system membrane fusion protein
MAHLKKIIAVIIMAVLLLGIFKWNDFFGGKKQQAPEGGPMPVMIAKPVVKNVERYHYFTGKTQASESVEIRARVKGYLEKVAFIDSENVEPGQLLFEIESAYYVALRDKAKAQVLSAQAELLRAEQDFERVQVAVKSNAVSKQQVSLRKAEKDMAEANVIAEMADLKQSELDLSYTKITSPIAGRISRKLVDVGNLVGASEMTLLTNIVKIEPIDVYFNVSENILIKELRSRPDKKTYREQSFEVGLSEDKGYPFKGEIDFLENRLDDSTGTIEIRGKLANEDNSILPGMFVKIRVPAGIKKNAVLVNNDAIGTNLAGKYVMVVGEGNVAKQIKIEVAENIDSMRVVESGLTGDEQYIISGIQFLMPGMPVQVMDPEEMAPPVGEAQKPESKKD